MASYAQIKREGRKKGFSGQPETVLLQGRGGRCFFLGYWNQSKYGEDPFDKNEQGPALKSFDGFGTLFNPADGEEYHGEWKNSRLLISGTSANGRAAIIINGMNLYVGDIQNDEPTGNGQITFGERGGILDRYEGEIKNGVPHGKGKLIWRFDTEYEGTFVDGKLEGNTKVRLPKGVVMEAIFKKDSLERYRVIAPLDHPLKSDDFQQPVMHQPNVEWHHSPIMYLGDPNGYCIGLLSNRITEGMHKDGIMHGEGFWTDLSKYRAVITECENWVEGSARGNLLETAIMEKGAYHCFYDTALVLETFEGNKGEKEYEGNVHHTVKMLRKFKYIGALKLAMASIGVTSRLRTH